MNQNLQPVQVEIRNFELCYDGIYFIRANGKSHYAFMPLSLILQMLKLEGIPVKVLKEQARHQQPILFSKVVLLTEAVKRNGRTYYRVSPEAEKFRTEHSLPAQFNIHRFDVVKPTRQRQSK
jgi:hypothetical protein